MRVRPPLGAALFFCLLAVTLLVGALVVRARTPDLELEVTYLTREVEAGGDPARVTFFVRDDEPRATVEIADEDGETVRTLDPSAALVDDREVTYRWDGRGDSGAPVPRESYFLRVELPSHDREMVWPKRIEVVGPDPPAGG